MLGGSSDGAWHRPGRTSVIPAGQSAPGPICTTPPAWPGGPPCCCRGGSCASTQPTNTNVARTPASPARIAEWIILVPPLGIPNLRPTSGGRQPGDVPCAGRAGPESACPRPGGDAAPLIRPGFGCGHRWCPASHRLVTRRPPRRTGHRGRASANRPVVVGFKARESAPSGPIVEAATTHPHSEIALAHPDPPDRGVGLVCWGRVGGKRFWAVWEELFEKKRAGGLVRGRRRRFVRELPEG